MIAKANEVEEASKKAKSRDISTDRSAFLKGLIAKANHIEEAGKKAEDREMSKADIFLQGLEDKAHSMEPKIPQMGKRLCPQWPDFKC